MGGARPKLGVVSLALITYFNVSGGPWGSEPIVASCGPLVGILATLVFPFIWCLPLALSFAELFSAFPTDSSFCTWVGKAFGRPMGFYVGYWSWVAGVIDNAIYPCLMVDSVFAVLVGPDRGTVKTFLVPLWMYIVRCIVATAFMLPTIYSIDAVGRFLLVLGIAMIFPFIVLVLVSVPQIDPTNWLVVRDEPKWSQLVSVLYWSYSGFDAAGAYASEIDSPRKTYPRAMMLTVFLVALTYSIPFFAASGVDKPHYELWADGFYPIIAEQISGPSLRSWFLVCAILGNLGVYIAKMTKNGFQLAGMADLGLAPSYFIERTASNGVPRRAILLCYSIIMFMAMFDFNVILGVDNFLSSLACVTELCAVVRLRFKAPDLERPYKVSLSDRGLFAMMVVPFCIGSFVMINEFTKSKLSVALNVIALGCGALYHRQLRHSPSYIYSTGKVQLTELGLLSPEFVVASPTQFLLQADAPKPVYT
uniref:Amino acid permease/ SLC12A domain-containing protein n=1 Tax=Globisporangium ultimum (strain ATCC 200006 / CBS 805.95 / DAOM BR144) TaxID=431595 RepID=K3W970_GLOUD